MVQVVERNHFTITCTRCKSKLSYTYDEVRDCEVNHDYLGDYDIVKGIECPVCNSILRHLR